MAYVGLAHETPTAYEVAMEDVFGGLAGNGGKTPGRAGTPPDDETRERLEVALDGAALWGLELDATFRVLAATLEPRASRYAWGESEDRRLQLLCFPVSTILASLRRDSGESRELLEFGEQQLVDVVAMFDGAPVQGPLFGQPEPRPGSWGPRFSMEGRSSAPDGTSMTLTITVRHDELSLDLFARFDGLELKGPDGSSLDLSR